MTRLPTSNLPRSALLAITLAVSVTTLAQAQTAPDYAKKLDRLYRHTVDVIQPAELRQLQQSGQPFLLLDTRSPQEYGVSRILRATVVNYRRFQPERFESLDRSLKIVLYCSVGYRSERIGEKLLKMGFKDVANLYGGIFEWKNQGHTVVTPSNQPTERVHAYNRRWGQWLRRGIKVFKNGS
jgi:rhodanese-related sulfurtransferase